MEEGMIQMTTGLEALCDVKNLDVTVGIVTDYAQWVFMISDDQKIRMHQCKLALSDSLPTNESLKDLVGKIHGLLANVA
ncbi:TPA: hypothetical protein N0F65_000093 [Lagenidium giganteum]|uniref:Uncharacterized protein n=1 Tax=Lagenidium giganteum TaxID=4803 RepID=A0AAV2YNE2_9STRA|nr:TPA: hypothetical protein N0F65_000093 [Lagenidium giganteum]